MLRQQKVEQAIGNAGWLGDFDSGGLQAQQILGEGVSLRAL
jgi:hypothetical protein